MTDLTAQPVPIPPVSVIPLQLLGDNGAACVGDFCDVPLRNDRAAVIDLLDSGKI